MARSGVVEVSGETSVRRKGYSGQDGTGHDLGFPPLHFRQCVRIAARGGRRSPVNVGPLLLFIMGRPLLSAKGIDEGADILRFPGRHARPQLHRSRVAA